jgi:hypothetical protein
MPEVSFWLTAGRRGTGEGSSCGLARRWIAPMICATLISPSPIARYSCSAVVTLNSPISSGSVML